MVRSNAPGGSSRRVPTYLAEMHSYRATASGGSTESGRRRYCGVSATQDSSSSWSVAATSGSYARSSISSTDSASASRPSTSGSGLTEENVARAADYYEYAKAQNDRAGRSEKSSSRDAHLRATLREVDKKLSSGQK